METIVIDGIKTAVTPEFPPEVEPHHDGVYATRYIVEGPDGTYDMAYGFSYYEALEGGWSAQGETIEHAVRLRGTPTAFKQKWWRGLPYKTEHHPDPQLSLKLEDDEL